MPRLAAGNRPVGWTLDKQVSLEEAVALVRPGDTLALGGLMLYRRPLAFTRELIRAGTGDLTLLALTAGMESDLLVGAGLIRKVRTCYFGLEVFGLAPMFTAQASELEIVEESETSLAFGIRAATAGVDALPGRAWLGTDLLRVRPDVKVVKGPYDGRPYVAFPAIRPDVLVLHVPMADRQGASVLLGNLSLDREMALVADRVIVTAEEIVDEVNQEVGVVPLSVDAVVHAPRGAYPTSCYPYYPLAASEILDYVESCRGGGFEAYLQRFLSAEPAVA
ncbi:MAG: CoA transferase subunit A [Anaerolineae bacterium]